MKKLLVALALAIVVILAIVVPLFAGQGGTGMGSTGTVTVVVPTTTSVTSSQNPSTFGQSVSFTATVSPDTAPGTVQFTIDGSNFGSPVALSGGTASSIPTSSLAVGNHAITAVYNGHGSFLTSTGTLPGGQTVNKAMIKTYTFLNSVPNSSDPGQKVTFIAAVKPEGFNGIPTGTVTFLDGTTVLGTGKLYYFGLSSFATFSIFSLSVGSHTITSVYGGDIKFLGSTSNPVVQFVLYDTKTTLTSTPNSTTFGQNVTFTAQVKRQSPGSGSPTGGNVNFYDGCSFIGSAILLDGSASLSLSNLPVGSHNVTACYTGDSNDNGSMSSTITQKVNKANTTMALITSVTPSVFGQSVKFTASVTPDAATGSVTFKDGNTTLGTASLSGGSAFITVSTLKVGSHTITANYNGDSNYNSSSKTVSQQVNKANTTTILTFTKSGSTVNFTATVSAVSPGTGTPSGSVNFFEGSTKIGTGTLVGGKATFSKANLTGHSISAVYSGDNNFPGSTSNIVKP
jgi:large repetitive protein